MTRNYYDNLAPYYKYLHLDWEESVKRHAKCLDSVIREFFGAAKTVLDVSCGIGTQSLGLAALGYRVAASDISGAALKIAKNEAAKRGLHIDFRRGDMRRAARVHNKRFDIVLSADNSVPHLLTDANILKAFRQFYALLNPGGGCIISVRDYAGINRKKRRLILNPRSARAIPGGKIVLFDLWEFDGNFYDMTTYLIKDRGTGKPRTLAFRSRYYCVTTARLRQLMRRAGFAGVSILKDRFFQPLLIGRKP